MIGPSSFSYCYLNTIRAGAGSEDARAKREDHSTGRGYPILFPFFRTYKCNLTLVTKNLLSFSFPSSSSDGFAPSFSKSSSLVRIVLPKAMWVKVSIWEPAVNSLSGVDPLPYESVPRVQGMSAPNVFSLFRCRSSLCLWRPFSSRPFSSVWIQSHPSRGCRESCLCSFFLVRARHSICVSVLIWALA